MRQCGAKTTEFWLAAASTMAALVVIVFAMAFKWDLAAALLGTALSPALTYIGGRSAVKGLTGAKDAGE